MRKIDIKQLYKSPTDFDGKEILVGGWVRSVREMKTFAFMDLNDGSAFKGAQIVLNIENLKNFEQASKLNAGSSVLVQGTFVLTPENKQPFEIVAKNIEIISATDETYPLQK